jgi:hypothetical protein
MAVKWSSEVLPIRIVGQTDQSLDQNDYSGSGRGGAAKRCLWALLVPRPSCPN